MKGNLFAIFPPNTEIRHHTAEKPYPDVSVFFRNIACFDLSCFFALCNVYNVSNEKGMFTKIGIREAVERIVSGTRGGREGKGESSFPETEWEVLEEG
jgi:hypothetical protein